MKSAKLFFIGMSVFFLFTQVKGQDSTSTQAMTLEQCIEYALKTNVNMLNARLEVETAKATVGEVKAMGLPQITGDIRTTWNYKVPISLLPASIIPEDQRPPGIVASDFVPVEFSTKFQGNAGINVNQLLFDGTYFLGLKAADTYTKLSVKAIDVTKSEVVAGITKIYYGVLVMKERQGIIKGNIKRISNLLRETTAMYENGFVEELDVDKLQVTYNNLENEQTRLNRFVESNLNLLKYQMGMPVYENLELVATLTEVTMNTSILESESVDYSLRPEYAVFQVQREIDMLDEKRYKVGYYPTVNLFGSAGYNMGSNDFDFFRFKDDTWFRNGAVGLQVNIPIFDGFRKKYQIQQAKLKLQKTDLSIIHLKKTIDWERKDALINLNNAITSLESQSKNMELAKKVIDKAQIKYKEGVGSSMEINNAETELLNAQNNYFSALYDALIAKVSYDKALGKLTE
ncbi:MAG: outer membrane protein [Arenicella sp.]|jgi:outer membrane protein